MKLCKLLSMLQTWLYNGVDRQFYIDHAVDIHHHNEKMLKILSRFAVLCFGFYLLCSIYVVHLRNALPLYLTFFVLLLLFNLFLERFCPQNHLLSVILRHIFSALCLGHSVLLGTVFSPTHNATMFFVLSLALTCVFYTPLLESMLFNLVFGLLFLKFSFALKASEFAVIDCCNWIACYGVICIVGYSLHHAQTNIMKTHDELECACNTDELTGLNNRRSMNQYLSHAYRLSSRVHIAILDVDDFKIYNDTYGHIQGDYCLQAIAEVLSEKSQHYGYYVARYGGEEFCIIDTLRSAAEMQAMIQDILDSVFALHIKNEHSPQPYISLSAGIASKEDYVTQTCFELLQFADEALYAAKEDGKNTLMVLEPVLINENW